MTCTIRFVVCVIVPLTPVIVMTYFPDEALEGTETLRVEEPAKLYLMPTDVGVRDPDQPVG